MSSMAYQPEPIHLAAQHVADGVIRVVRGDGEMIVQSNSADFVADAIRELKVRGHHPDTSVVILGVCGNTAFNGALKHV
jgi:hypothetical protein